MSGPDNAQRLSRDEMRSRQLTCLKATAAYVYEKLPFYRHLFDGAGIGPKTPVP